jgi:hypothetical protein
LFVASFIQGKARPDVIVTVSPATIAAPGFAKWQADSIKEGIEPEFKTSIKAWKFNDKEIETRTAVNLQEINQPFLYFYFSKDPLWEGYDEVSRLAKEYKHQEQTVSESRFEEISIQENIVGVQFNFSGHSFVDDGKYPDHLEKQKKLIVRFLKEKLK